MTFAGAAPDRYARGWLLYNSGRFALATEEVLARLAEHPNDADGFILLAYCQNELKSLDALATARKAIELAPDYAWSHYAHSLVVHRAGKMEESERAVRRAIELNARDAHFFGHLAFLLIAQKRWRAALAAANEGLAIHATDRVCLSNRSLALRILGQYRDAAETIEIGLKHYPEDAFLHATWGWVLLYRNESRLAEHHFRESLRLNPFLTGPNPKKGIRLAWIGRTWLGRRYVQWWLWDNRIGQQIRQ